MKKEDILEKAKNIITGERQNAYGEVEDNFQTIANLFNAYLKSKANCKSEITAQDVAVMMILVKVARISSGHHKDDNWIDIAGYAACGGSIEPVESSSDVNGLTFTCAPDIDDDLIDKVTKSSIFGGLSIEDIKKVTDINGTPE